MPLEVFSIFGSFDDYEKDQTKNGENYFFPNQKKTKARPNCLPCPLLSFQGLVGGTEDLLADDQEGEGTAAAGVDLLL